MPKTTAKKRETLKSLRAELAEERRLRACDTRDYQGMLIERNSSYREMVWRKDGQINEAVAAIHRAHEQLQIAGRKFTDLAATLALVCKVTAQAGSEAAAFGDAYRPDQAQTPGS